MRSPRSRRSSAASPERRAPHRSGRCARAPTVSAAGRSRCGRKPASPPTLPWRPPRRAPPTSPSRRARVPPRRPSPARGGKISQRTGITDARDPPPQGRGKISRRTGITDVRARPRQGRWKARVYQRLAPGVGPPPQGGKASGGSQWYPLRAVERLPPAGGREGFRRIAPSPRAKGRFIASPSPSTGEGGVGVLQCGR